MTSLGLRIGAYARLGAVSLARVIAYRAGLKTGLHPVHRIRPPDPASGPVFGEAVVREPAPGVTPAWCGRPWAFGREVGPPTDTPPQWHANILTGAATADADRRWDRIPAFGSGAGDIKTVWEASRFDWVLAFSQAAARGDRGALDRLDRWLEDWVARNPAYFGPNWMCGQEASIRVLHLVAASIILGRFEQPSPGLQTLLFAHLRRILPTVSYALGQDNNHATSEAAALFAGGAWLLVHGPADTAGEARRFMRAGRKLLDQGVGRLVFEDGGFSQYSIVYHRVMLDAVSVAELVRRRLDLPSFRPTTVRRLALAAGWLDAVTIEESGDAPNLGANDGAWLLPIGPGVARDFRPSIALSSALFRGVSRYADIPSAADQLAWLELDVAGLPQVDRPRPTLLADSGVILLERADVRAWLRAPRHRFRPGQADALHLDLWVGGTPIFIDSGSYSYADPDHGGRVHFGSVEAHNTVQFDGRDQMPRIGRFLLGAWIQARVAHAEPVDAEASYVDYRGCEHRRRVRLEAGRVLVTDSVRGFASGAVLRWRTEWPVRADDRGLIISVPGLGGVEVRFAVDGDPVYAGVSNGEVSIDYHAVRPVSVISLAVDRAATLETTISIVPRSHGGS